MPKKLPIGIQTFEKIRTGNYIYIDKTKEAYDLIDTYDYVFLARPRRFGKSLFIDTLKNIFEGRKELFEGLYIYNKWNWDEKYPVIKIDWSGNFQTLENLEKTAMEIFENTQEILEIKCKSDKPDGCFRELIRKTYKKHNQKVVILVDEYDKPILDVIENQKQAIENREFLKGLYSIIKSSDEYIKFAFLTGVSKFSKASIFSGLNMLVDISLLPKYGNICGYTEEDIKEKFKEYLDDIDLKEMSKWYDGYWFLKDKLYNPFDILQYLQNKTLKNYWFTSGTPSFLIKLLKEKRYYLPRFSNIVVDEELLNTFDIDEIKVETILFQTGYLTIKRVLKEDEITEYELTIPNKEVKISLSKYIINKYLNDDYPDEKIKPIRKALKKADLEALKNTFISVFASIPYTESEHIKKYEGFYASIAYVYLQALGIDIIGEDVTNKGRIDLTLFIEDKIYIIEFKVIANDKEQGTALKQIKEKKYHEKYIKEDKEIYLVGMEFSEEEKNIVNFEWEKI